MNARIKDALERVERAQTLSKQPRLGAEDRERLFMTLYKWSKGTWAEEPPYKTDSRVRDKWLSEVWRKEPHIAGVVNTVTSIDRNRDWSLTGGRNVVNRYNTILRGAEDGEGWRYFIGRAALAFYTSDIGAITEIGRDGEEGPMRALYNVDPARCRLTGRLNRPLEYLPASGKEQLWGPDDYFRTTALPSISEEFLGLGFCAVSRALSFIQLMIAVYEHDMEKLCARAPKGLLLLQNISEQQWLDAMKARDANMSRLERDYFGGVSVLAQEGVDQIDAKLVALSQLPDGFDLEQTTKMAMLGLALCFGYDPIEFWAIDTGALGRSRESEIQHSKATGKGGVEFTRTYQDRLQQELPPTLLFEFEQRDVAGELSSAQVQKAWADVFNVFYDKGTGVLDRDEVRQLMAQQGLIPAEWTEAEELAQADSTGMQRQRAQEWVSQPAVWRSAFTEPTEPLVQYSYLLNRTKTLSPSGYAFLQEHHRHPMARQMYDEMPRPEFHELFSARVFPVVQIRAAEDDVLYSKGDVEITLSDVTAAIEAGRKRVGKQYAELLLAEPEEE